MELICVALVYSKILKNIVFKATEGIVEIEKAKREKRKRGKNIYSKCFCW